jgi:RNA polymerase sigma-70 factor, ECF subfamily
MSDDCELLQQLRGKTPEPALGELIQRHGALVVHTATRIVGAGAADDVCQSVFLVLMKKVPTLKNSGALTSWLYQTTVWVSREYQRGEQRRKRREKAAAEMMNSRNENKDEAPSLPAGFDEVVARMPEIYRRTILLRFLQNQSRADVAKTMGVNEATVDMRTNRALERLRRTFVAAVPGISAVSLQKAMVLESAIAQPLSSAQVAAIQAVCAGKAAASLAVKTAANATLNQILLAKLMFAGGVVAAVALVGAAGYAAMRSQPTEATPRAALATNKLPRESARVMVLQRSIERDDPPEYFWKGIVGPGPNPADGRVCVAAETVRQGTDQIMDVYVRSPQDTLPLWTYSADLELTLEIHAEVEVGTVTLSVGAADAREFHLPFPDGFARGQWTTLNLPLSKLALGPTPDGAPPPEGQPLQNLVFTTPKGRFWLDNIMITRRATPGETPSQESQRMR